MSVMSLNLDKEDIWSVVDTVKDSFKPEEKEKTPEELSPKCTKCSETEFEQIDGLICCSNCGLEFSHYIDTSQEWRFYGADDNKMDNPTRCGPEINNFFPESSLGTVILGNKYFNQNNKYLRLQKYTQMPSAERSDWSVLNLIKERTANKGISKSIIDNSMVLYRKIKTEKISRGANRWGLIAASIFYSCRKSGITRTAKEIGNILSIKEDVVTNGIKECNRICNQKNISLDTRTSSSNDFIERYCQMLNIDYRTYLFIKEIAKKAEEIGIVAENTPPSISAGSIFFVSEILGLQKTKNDIHNTTGISIVTITKTYKRLLKYKSTLLKDINIDSYEDQPLFWH